MGRDRTIKMGLLFEIWSTCTSPADCLATLTEEGRKWLIGVSWSTYSPVMAVTPGQDAAAVGGARRR
jgi:hypothetical protein